MVEPYEDRWPQALGLLYASPRTGVRVVRDLIDDVWHLAGDESVDVRFLIISWFMARVEKWFPTRLMAFWFYIFFFNFPIF
jgi:hypothetical protein